MALAAGIRLSVRLAMEAHGARISSVAEVGDGVSFYKLAT